MHTTEMVADACPDSVGIARRNRSSAGAELSRRCYLVVAVVAPVSTTVEVMTAAERAVKLCGVDGPRHQARPGLTHRQTVLGALEDRRGACPGAPRGRALRLRPRPPTSRDPTPIPSSGPRCCRCRWGRRAIRTAFS